MDRTPPRLSGPPRNHAARWTPHGLGSPGPLRNHAAPVLIHHHRQLFPMSNGSLSPPVVCAKIPKFKLLRGCSSVVERLLPKQDIVGSNPITRSKTKRP